MTQSGYNGQCLPTDEGIGEAEVEGSPVEGATGFPSLSGQQGFGTCLSDIPA